MLRCDEYVPLSQSFQYVLIALPVVFLGTLNSSVVICDYTSSGGALPGCYNLSPVFQWIERCIISIFLVFMIAFLPLFIQGNSSLGFI